MARRGGKSECALKGEGLGPEERVFCWRQDHALYESYFTLGDLWGIIRYLTPS